jgi:hypothetical protein
MSLTGCEAKGFGPGQITSNSEMAMCLLPATKDGVKLLNLNRILAKLGLWKIHGPYFLGNTQEGL